MKTTFRKCAALLLALAIVLAAAPAGRAVFTFDDKAAATLSTLGVLEQDWEAWLKTDALSREEAAALLVRLTGREAEAKAVYTCAFPDVSEWARGYVAVAVRNGLAAGQPDGRFAGSRAVTDRDFCTMLLRALGYSDARGDFTWAKAPEFAAMLGVGDGYIKSFTRADAVQLAYAALLTRVKGGSAKLIEKLYAAGAISREALLATPLAGYANYGKPVYTAAELYERFSAAVFYIRTYDSQESLEIDEPMGTGSGFFIDSEGTALMCYHQIEGMPIARATTADGRVYAVDNVLWYDTLRDLALVKLSKTDIEGRTVRSFPFMPVGDSDAMAAGEPVFTITNPISLKHSVSQGVVSAVSRVYDDENYPVVQFTAAISPGSSGGPLLNSHGEVVGVVMAYFASGNDLYLAVPANYAVKADRFAAPMTMNEVYETEKAKNAAATVTASLTEVTVRVGESVKVVCTRDCPGSASLSYNIDDPTVAACRWGQWSSKFTVPLTIIGVDEGETVVKVTYTPGTGNPNAVAEIHVTVLPNPDLEKQADQYLGDAEG